MTGFPTLTVELEDGSGNFTNDISAYCHLPSALGITRGRVDEQTDVTSGEVTLLLHNPDGRFTLGSASYNGIKADKRARITETYNATVYRRSVMYVQEWPTQWESGVANLAYASLTLVDRQARLARRKLLSTIAQEILADGPTWYWPCTELSPATTAGDLSGKAGTPLVATGTGTAPEFGGGTLGVDGLPAPLLAVGQYLAPLRALVLASAATAWTFEFEFATTTATQDLANVGMTIVASMTLTSGVLSFASASGGTNLADGATHHVAYTYAGGVATLYLDGVSIGSPSIVDGGSTTPTFLLGLGATAFSGTIGQAAFFTSALSSTRVASHANAARNGFFADRADQRIARLAGYANIVTGDQNLETGQQLSIAAGATDGQYALDAMRAVVQAEGGLLFISGTGQLTMQNKSHRVVKATASPGLTLTADQVDPKSLKVSGDKDYLFNTGAGSRSGGAQQRIINVASVGEYEEYAVERDVALLPTDELLLNLLQWLTTMYSEPQPRISQLTLNLHTLPTATVQAALALELGDFIRLSSLPTQSPAVSMDLLVEGFKENLTDQTWTLTLNTVPAPLFRAWILGDATYSVLDSTTRLYF